MNSLSEIWELVADAHLAVALGVDVDDVMAAVVVTAMDEHGVENVPRCVLRVRCLQELI